MPGDFDLAVFTTKELTEWLEEHHLKHKRVLLDSPHYSARSFGTVYGKLKGVELDEFICWLNDHGFHGNSLNRDSQYVCWRLVNHLYKTDTEDDLPQPYETLTQEDRLLIAIFGVDDSIMGSWF